MTETSVNLALKKESASKLALPAIRTRFSSDGNARCIVVLRQERQFNSINLHLYHYAGNNPVRYTDPDGKIYKVFTLNKNSQDNLISQLSNTKRGSDSVNDISIGISWLSSLPTPISGLLGMVGNLLSSGSMITNSMPSNFISAYNETLIDALKNYSDGKSFDSNCSLELVFATTETYAGKQDDFATVWNGLQNNPNLRTSDLPDKMETNYFVTLRWKDKDGKTLGGKTIQLENQAEFNSLCKQVETAGGVNEEK